MKFITAPFKMVDRFLNGITMYRFLAVGLFVLALYAVIAAFFELLPFGVLPYLYSLGIILPVAWISNVLCGKLWNVPTNAESWAISGLILFFILFPVVTVTDAWIAAAGALITTVSKYLINYDGKHLFNPVAIAAVILSFSGSGNVTWWVATPSMFPLVLILGLLIVRKIRKFELFGIYVFLATLVHWVGGTSLSSALFSYPTIFFGAIMLTEPLTMPGRKRDQNIYAACIALLPLAPQLALVVGNFFAFLFGYKHRPLLRLTKKEKIANGVYEFSFASEKGKKISFLPGQFFDWTFEYPRHDFRGNRRYFTIASSPTESEVKIGVRIGEKGSTFKKALEEMKEGTIVAAGGLGGDFVLPSNTNEKLVCIAGGIGVTPFRSFIQYLIDTNEKRDIVLFYTVATESDIAYKPIFEKAQNMLGIKVVYVVTSTAGFITKEMIAKEVPDFSSRTFFISGPNVMVENYTKLLRELGVKKILTDYFPGF